MLPCSLVIADEAGGLPPLRPHVARHVAIQLHQARDKH